MATTDTVEVQYGCHKCDSMLAPTKRITLTNRFQLWRLILNSTCPTCKGPLWVAKAAQPGAPEVL
jgi:hypothetical protein